MSKAAESLGMKIHRELLKRNWSQSDFARKLWPGETIIDGRGYTAPRGRDRVSSWLADKATPTPASLRRIADVLGMDINELSPGVLSSASERESPAVSITQMPGAPDRCLLRVNKLLPFSVAIKIAALIDEAESAK